MLFIKGGGLVPNELDKKRNKQNQNDIDKILAIPGVKEAIKMVRRCALKGAREDAWVRHFLRRLPDEDATKLVLDNSMVDYDLSDELLESLACKSGPKIAELWNLSERAGDKLAEIIYWSEDVSQTVTPPGKRSYLFPFDLVINIKDPKIVNDLNCRGAIVTSRKGMLPNHIYLDVTYLPYDVLHIAYRSIISLRKSLGVQKEDLREGAPETFDTTKALKCAELADSGKSKKTIARELNFYIYTRDNPSGTYPLFRKYLKKGLEIREKLNALGNFLDDEISSLLEQL
jgi:hypothetical protein